MTSSANIAADVVNANRMLPKLGLVVMHSGNASGIDRLLGKVYIKPSGLDYEVLTVERLALIDFESGNNLTPSLAPSVDTPQHLRLYQEYSDIGGIVHTHSNYATAFAALERPIPAVLTAIADQFGGDIPCAPYADNHLVNLAESVIRFRTSAPAILLGHHGVLAWGADAESAIKSAAMVEDLAKTVWIAMTMGELYRLSESEIDKWRSRYTTTYGQMRST